MALPVFLTHTVGQFVHNPSFLHDTITNLLALRPSNEFNLPPPDPRKALVPAVQRPYVRQYVRLRRRERPLQGNHRDIWEGAVLKRAILRKAKSFTG